jgi:soluble lytic murein transglycosylase-like protein
MLVRGLLQRLGLLRPVTMPIDAASLGTQSLQQPSNQQQAQPQTHSKTSFWHELIANVASAAGIDPNLAVGVATQESGLNPHAVNPSSGAVGMMQLMPGTAAALGVNPHDVMGNIQGGIRYLREQLTNFGDEAKALAAYNWGPQHVTQAVKRWGAGWLSHAPSETQHYVNSVLARAGVSGSSGLTGTALNEGSSTATASSASASHLNPGLAAEVANLRSALDAYLLSEVLS